MPNKTRKPTHFTQAMLKQRGWSAKLIELLLGEPDQLKTNPIYRSAPPMKLYLIRRVKQAEKRKAFVTFQPGRVARKLCAQKAVKTKEARVLAYIESLTIKIPKFQKSQLYKLACNHYNQLWAEREHYDKHASVTDDEVFLQRISVNFLRHGCSKYETVLDNLFGQVGITSGYFDLRDKIFAKISECYPFLQSECDRQNGEETTQEGMTHIHNGGVQP